MRLIKALTDDIECNIREAEDKVTTAYRMRSEHPSIAVWYRDMAQAHLNFNIKAHELISSEIANYKSSKDYEEHPEYADGMLAVWRAKHADMIANTARVKAMVDSYK